MYGLPELHADAIQGAKLLANPDAIQRRSFWRWRRGCAPVDVEHRIVQVGKTGAGEAPSAKTHFVEVDGDFSAYNVFGHRHTGEMLEQLGLGNDSLQFTPHLLPIPRGILSTIYVKLAKTVPAEELEQCLEFYAGKPWVRVFARARLPQIKFSRHTNFCDIGFSLSPNSRARCWCRASTTC